MTYFKHKQPQEQPQRRFLHPIQDDENDMDELLTEEDEELLRREGNLRLAMSLGDLLGIILGVVFILLLLAVLISLGNWLHDDVSQFFSLWMERI